jgi:hypothetical protein
MPDDRTAGVRIRPVLLAQDIPLLHHWFSMPRASFWGMRDLTVDQVHATYRKMLATGHVQAWMGSFGDAVPAFLFEAYDPAFEEVGEHYPVRPGDLGMHCFVGPPRGAPVPDFTRKVFRSLMRFLFEEQGAKRIVVEPDLYNRKVHVLNREMGFVYERALDMRQKRAALAFCRREDHYALHPTTDPRKDSTA